jgi:hypothetical protein
MVRTIHGRLMVMIMLIRGLTLLTWSTPVDATSQQRRRPQYQCRTCQNSSSQQTPGKHKDAITDLTEPPDLPAMTTDDPPAPSSSSDEESDTEEEEESEEPINPLEIVGAAAILLFFIVGGMRWNRARS